MSKKFWVDLLFADLFAAPLLVGLGVLGLGEILGLSIPLLFVSVIAMQLARYASRQDLTGMQMLILFPSNMVIVFVLTVLCFILLGILFPVAPIGLNGAVFFV